jgi:DNA-binding MarR family transcriptional regulator
MRSEPDVTEVATALRLAIGQFLRRFRQLPADGDLTVSESSVLSRLDKGGPATASALAVAEQISAQSLGATVAALEQRGLVTRASDPDDGRRIVVTVSPAGRALLRDRRDTRTAQLAAALEQFTSAERNRLAAVVPLIERLAETI